MIASISGIITHLNDSKMVLLQGGIGFEMSCPSARLMQVNTTIQLYTYLHWSQENGPSLYGFSDLLQKDLFLMLIDCQGIGPKLGVSMLEQTEPMQLLQLISQENTAGLSKIKGLGAKKAEVLCMHLKDKVSKLLTLHPQLNSVAGLGVWNDLHDTLISLNYSTFEIKQATAMVKETVAGQTVPFDLLLRKALQVLAKK
jgi:holliday junction DNA helicase RuvA